MVYKTLSHKVVSFVFNIKEMDMFVRNFTTFYKGVYAV